MKTRETTHSSEAIKIDACDLKPRKPSVLSLKHVVRIRFAANTHTAVNFCIEKYNRHMKKFNEFVLNGDERRMEYALQRALKSIYNLEILIKLDDTYEPKPVTYKRKKYKA